MAGLEYLIMGKNAARNRFNVNFIVVALFVWSMVFPGPARNALSAVGEGAGDSVASPRAPTVWLVSLPATNTVVTENFNTLVNSGTSSSLPFGWSLAESGTNANTTYAAGTGSSNAGDTYSFGAASSTERALGALQSGNLAAIVGAMLQNDTGVTVNALGINYVGEQWRLGAITGGADKLQFAYSLDASSLTSGSWISPTSLEFSSPLTSGTVGFLDGNAAANRRLIAATITGLSLSSGATIWLRWVDNDKSGSDDGLAIDDFSVVALASCTAALLALDDANNYATGSWTNGSNAGYGLSPWALAGTATSGFFVGTSANNGAGTTSPNIDTNGVAWGLYGNSGQTASAIRPLISGMAVGDALSLRMDNGNIQTGGTVGMGIQNGSANNLMEVYFAGGASNYTVNDAAGATDSGLGFSSTGIIVTVTLATATTYNVALTRQSDGASVSLNGRSLLNPAGARPCAKSGCLMPMLAVAALLMHSSITLGSSRRTHA